MKGISIRLTGPIYFYKWFWGWIGLENVRVEDRDLGFSNLVYRVERISGLRIFYFASECRIYGFGVSLNPKLWEI